MNELAIQTIETTDLFKGAYLLCSGGILYDIRFRRNRQTASFVFEGHSLDRLDNDYMTGKALVNPLQYRETLNRLRDILFEKLNQSGRERHDRKRNDRSRQKQHRPQSLY